ncbi:hypothetical protein DRQ36_05660 [bacterium]|nr:MAG: hypothetical protein DRQ36_05660 [bacterium]
MRNFWLFIAVLLLAGVALAWVSRSCVFPVTDIMGFDAPKEAMDVATAIDVDFEDDTLDGWVIVSVDTGSTYWSIFEAVGYAHSDPNFAGCYYDTAHIPAWPNDDWLITEPVAILDTTYSLTFWVRSIDTSGSWLDDYQVWASRTDSLPSSFIDSLDGETAVDWNWHERDISLSAFAGDTIRVGFRYNSTDKYMIMLDDINISGGTPVDERPNLAEDYYIIGNIPNPFNAATIIRVNKPCDSTIEIFDLNGHLVRDLPVDGSSALWDGRTDDGENVPCGVYLYRLKGSEKTHRIVFLK